MCSHVIQFMLAEQSLQFLHRSISLVIWLSDLFVITSFLSYQKGNYL